MTINANTSRVSFLTDGTSTTFPVAIQAYLNSDFRVYLTNNTTSVGTLLVLNSDYTLFATGTNSPQQWTLLTQTGQFVSPYISGSTLQVVLDPPRTQLAQYVAGETFPSSTLQNSFDRETQLSIRLHDFKDRALRAPDSDTATWPTLPVSKLRANLALIFDNNGLPAVGTPVVGTISTAVLAPFLALSQTTAEVTAGVTPTNLAYSPGNILRYGADPTLGTDSTAAIQAAINVACQPSGPVMFIPPGSFKVTSTIVIAAGKQPYAQGSGKFLSLIRPSGFSANQPVFDFQGTSSSRIDAIAFRDFAIWDGTNTALGIKANWAINSRFDDIYFYQLANGWSSTNSFGIGFRNNNSFSITTAVYVMGVNSNNIYWDKCRIASCNVGVQVTNIADTLAFLGCDFEGITAGGAAIFLAPVTTTSANNVVIIGNHFENINGNAVLCSGADANSVTGLVIEGNVITGGFAAASPPNASAINALVLQHVNGFSVCRNNITDWGTADASVGGTQGNAISNISSATNGVIENNTSILAAALPLTVHNICDGVPGPTVRVANNWVPVNGTNYAGTSWSYNNNPGSIFTAGYGGVVASAPGLTLPLIGDTFQISGTTGITSITASVAQIGRTIKLMFQGTLTVTDGGNLKLAGNLSAVATTTLSLFCYDGTNWAELGRSIN